MWLLLTALLSACSPPPEPATRHRKSTVHWVETTKVNMQTLKTKSVYTGIPRAKRIARIFTQETGRITYLPYYEGDTIKKNALLVKIDDALLKAELNKAIASHKYSQINVQRYQKLAKKHIISDDELARAQTEQEIARAEEHILRTRLNYTKIKSPFSGMITTRLREVGDVISANTHILTVISPRSLVIDVDVSEYILSDVSVGDAVEVQIDALGTKMFKGTVSRIHPSIHPTTHLGLIEVRLRPLPKKMREGQFCRVTITRTLSPRMMIPYTALRRDHHTEYVFIVDNDHKAQKQIVHSGQRFANRVEILDGVTQGQSVIIKGFLGLKSGKKVGLVH
ncbi:MAG: efflux RND transporter periplasmic adaptor subunit [Thiomargarita sp.]|nr:efflux RND transporter periplasmic adaptor subunit [Thiomargarita sp.]